MVKKEYVKPATQVEKFIVESMLATSSGSTDVRPNNPGGDPSANDRRGGWGDLWN